MNLGLFLLFCAWGIFFEWFFGFFWNVVGSSPWFYPDSFLRYTSWKMIPLWGLGGLTVLQLANLVRERNRRTIVHTILLLAFSMLWITILSIVT